MSIEIKFLFFWFIQTPNAGDGSYSWSIETTNGIAQQESGVGGRRY